MTWNFGPPQWAKHFYPKDQEGRPGRPVDGRVVGNPIKGFPFFMFGEMMLGGKPGFWYRHDGVTV